MSHLKISSEQFFNFAKQDKPEKLDKLVNKITNLSQKIQNPEDQSFYFRKALGSHKEDLKNLKNQYNRIRNHVNNVPIEVIERKHRMKKNQIERRKNRNIKRNWVERVGMLALKSDLNYLELILNLKEKYGSIPSLE